MTDAYALAVEAVVTERKASTSFIQRKLQIGYNAAAAHMERMERDGIVSAANHVGKRDILVGPDFKPSETAPPPPKAAPRPAPTGPVRRFICSGCDATGDGPDDGLPEGWYFQTSARLGEIPRCPDCAQKNASRIATSRMSTEEIMAAGQDGSTPDVIVSAAQGRVRTFIERIGRLREDAKAITQDLKEVGEEAKGEGFEWKILMRVAREIEKDPQKRKEEQELFDLYASAAGFTDL